MRGLVDSNTSQVHEPVVCGVKILHEKGQTRTLVRSVDRLGCSLLFLC